MEIKTKFIKTVYIDHEKNLSPLRKTGRIDRKCGQERERNLLKGCEAVFSDTDKVKGGRYRDMAVSTQPNRKNVRLKEKVEKKSFGDEERAISVLGGGIEVRNIGSTMRENKRGSPKLNLIDIKAELPRSNGNALIVHKYALPQALVPLRTPSPPGLRVQNILEESVINKPHPISRKGFSGWKISFRNIYAKHMKKRSEG